MNSTVIRRVVGRWGGALALCALLVGCGSAEKYQKAESSGDKDIVQGELTLALSEADQEFARDMTESLRVADLQCRLGDTTAALRITDSLMLVAENMLDSVALASPIQKFLLLVVTDGYGRIMQWESDADARAALTARHAALAERLQGRLDSAKGNTTP